MFLLKTCLNDSEVKHTEKGKTDKWKIRKIGFIIAQCKILKEQNKKALVIFIMLHIVIAVLGFIYCFKYADGENIIYNIQLIADI